jgi:hypothetical protein
MTPLRFIKKTLMIGIIAVGVFIVGLVGAHFYTMKKERKQIVPTRSSVAPPESKRVLHLKPVRREGGGSVDHVEADSYETNIEPDYTMDDIVLKNGARIREVGYSIRYLGEITGEREPVLEGSRVFRVRRAGAHISIPDRRIENR